MAISQEHAKRKKKPAGHAERKDTERMAVKKKAKNTASLAIKTTTAVGTEPAPPLLKNARNTIKNTQKTAYHTSHCLSLGHGSQTMCPK